MPKRQGQNELMVQFGPDAPPVRRVPTPLARRYYQICVAVVADAIADEDLSAMQFAVLPYLSRDTGEPGLDQSGIAARLGIDRNNTSHLIDQLEAKGIVERRVNKTDRRAHMLHLTPNGEKLCARLLPRTRAANERILAPLAPHERKLFIDMLIRIIQGNFAYARPGAGRRKGQTSKSVGKGKGGHHA